MASRTRSKTAEPTRMARIDDDVHAYIVKRARWGESINRTLRRLFKLPNGRWPKKGEERERRKADQN